MTDVKQEDRSKELADLLEEARKLPGVLEAQEVVRRIPRVEPTVTGRLVIRYATGVNTQ